MKKYQQNFTCILHFASIEHDIKVTKAVPIPKNGAKKIEQHCSLNVEYDWTKARKYFFIFWMENQKAL